MSNKKPSNNKPPEVMDRKELGVSRENFLRLEDILKIFAEHVRRSEQITDEEKTKLLQGISLVIDTSTRVKSRLSQAGQPIE